MKPNTFIFLIISLTCASMLSAAAPDAARRGFVVVTDFVPADGQTDVSDALQKVIDTHPNRTLYFPDGTYLLSKPIATPAEPTLSVDLQLSNYAILKAAPGWTNDEAMVRLGGIHPANNIRTRGSNYSFTGGIIDGSDVAKGISIDSGRETKVRCVSMKDVLVGLHIKHGANGNSSDADIADVNIVGNGATNSVGVFVESCDNTLSNMRIAGVLIGVKLTGSGNLMQNLHPLYAYRPSLNRRLFRFRRLPRQRQQPLPLLLQRPLQHRFRPQRPQRPQQLHRVVVREARTRQGEAPHGHPVPARIHVARHRPHDRLQGHAGAQHGAGRGAGRRKRLSAHPDHRREARQRTRQGLPQVHQMTFSSRMNGRSVCVTTSVFILCPPGNTRDMPG